MYAIMVIVTIAAFLFMIFNPAMLGKWIFIILGIWLLVGWIIKTFRKSRKVEESPETRIEDFEDTHVKFK